MIELFNLSLVGDVSPVWSNLEIIFKYGGLPSVMLVLFGVYLIFVNKVWANQIKQMQNQFNVQQSLLLRALNNSTSVLTALSTKLEMGCLLFQTQRRTEEVQEKK